MQWKVGRRWHVHKIPGTLHVSGTSFREGKMKSKEKKHLILLPPTLISWKLEFHTEYRLTSSRWAERPLLAGMQLPQDRPLQNGF